MIVTMIRIADKTMIPALERIWQTCFGDPPEYTAFVFGSIIPPGQALVETGENGEPRAMLCLRQAALVTPDGAAERCAYIFGVATLPQHRGGRLSTALLEAAHRHLETLGAAASVLVPADEGLFTFYGDRGYENAFPLMRATVTAEEISPAPLSCVLTRTTLEAMEQQRNAFFGGSRLFLRWDRDYLAAMDRETALSGGEVLRVSCAGHTGYAVCQRRGESVLVKELTTAGGPELLSFLAALHHRMGAQEYRLCLRGDTRVEFTNSVLPFGMVRWYDREAKSRCAAMGGGPAYLAHVLD